MKYNMYINQYALLENKIGIDLIDAHIVYLFLDTYSVSTISKIHKDKKYVLFTHNFVLTQCPILEKHIKTPRGFRDRMNNLISLKLLERYEHNQKERKQYYTVGVDANLLRFKREETFPHEGTNVPTRGNKSSHYNNITNNNITNNSLEDRKKEFFLTLQQVNSDHKSPLSKEELQKFYEYWSEHNDKGKKMRKEKEKVFNTYRRISTWQSNLNTPDNEPKKAAI